MKQNHIQRIYVFKAFLKQSLEILIFLYERSNLNYNKL